MTILIPLLLMCSGDVARDRAPAVLVAPVVRVIDGDTFTVDLPQCDIAEVCDDVSIRILDIDTPEMNDPSPCVRAMAEASRGRLRVLLPRGAFVRLSQRTADGFGRIVARVTLPAPLGGLTIDIGETLIREGYARPWTGRREPWTCTEETTP